MVQNVRREFNPRGDNKVFFINLVIMYWTLNSIYMQFEYQYSKSTNVSVEHVCAVIEGGVWIRQTEGDT